MSNYTKKSKLISIQSVSQESYDEESGSHTKTNLKTHKLKLGDMTYTKIRKVFGSDLNVIGDASHVSSRARREAGGDESHVTKRRKGGDESHVSNVS